MTKGILNRSKKNNINRLKSEIFNENKLVDSKLLDLTEKAENGDVYASSDLFKIYHEGKGIKQNQEKAEYYLRKCINHFNYEGDDAVKKGWFKSYLMYIRDYQNDYEGMINEFLYYLEYAMAYNDVEDWNWEIIRMLAEHFISEKEAREE